MKDKARFFEQKDGMVSSDGNIKAALFILTGKREDNIDHMLPVLCGIKREITDLNEWKSFVDTDWIGALEMYHALTGCSLVEAKEMIDSLRKDK